MIDRREFLKRLGFSAAAAAIGASVVRPAIVRAGGASPRVSSTAIREFSARFEAPDTSFRYVRASYGTAYPGSMPDGMPTVLAWEGSADGSVWHAIPQPFRFRA